MTKPPHGAGTCADQLARAVQGAPVINSRDRGLIPPVKKLRQVVPAKNFGQMASADGTMHASRMSMNIESGIRQKVFWVLLITRGFTLLTLTHVNRNNPCIH